MSWGNANWPIWMSWMVLSGCSRIETLMIFLARTTSWTCTGPYTVLAGWPVIVLSPAVRPPAWVPVGTTAPGPASDTDEDDTPAPVPLTVAVGIVGACDLNVSRATRPAMVAVIARIARRISRILPSELERLEVDPALRNSGGAERADGGRHHAGRPAHVDLLLVQPGHE